MFKIRCRLGSFPHVSFTPGTYDVSFSQVWGEEIIDRRLLSCERVYNEKLKTVDYIVNDRKVLVFRTNDFEKGRVVFQMGTGCRSLSLAIIIASSLS